MPTNSPDISPFALRLIRWFCEVDLQEEIEGNLIEYNQQINQNSRWSKWKFWYQVINYLRWSTMKNVSQNSKLYLMFNFNIKLAFRNLWIHKSTTFLNIGGYAVGMLCVSLLYFYVKGELSYDSFHKNKSEIYRVIRIGGMNDKAYKIGVTSGPFAEGLQMDFPSEIKATMRVYNTDGLVEYENKVFKEDNFFLADENFFEFFSFPLLVGDVKSVLSQPNSVVLTEAMARKYFGFEDPIGKTLMIDKEDQFVVTGIIGKFPTKSHLEFDFVASMNTYKNARFLTGWWNNGLNTYLQIENPLLADTMQDKFPQFMDKYFKKDFDRTGKRVDIALQPFEDIYFTSDMKYDWVKHGNKSAVYLLGFVALAILFIACFNYLNLAIALSIKRAKEVGMRKVLGGNRLRLTLQFLGESLIISLLAISLSIGLTEILVPYFNAYFDLEVVLFWWDSEVILFFGITLLATVVLSGLYPALLLSSFNPLTVFRGQAAMKRSSLLLRKGLVVAQFSISIIMIIVTLMIGEQLNFIKDKNLGFSQEAIILVDIDNREIREGREMFKDRLLENPSILTVSAVSGEPGGFHDATTLEFLGELPNIRMRTAFVDLDYIETFNIQLSSGRNFSKDYHHEDQHAALLNQRALEELGITEEEALSSKFRLSMWDTLVHEVVGVVENYHFSTLKDQIEPLMIVPGLYQRRIAVKVDPLQLNASLGIIEDLYKDIVPSYPISYEFLDDSLAQLYEDEKKQGKIFQAFSSISIFLACLGIFGLVSFTVERRRKEFGVRKVLGANATTIISLVSNEYVKIVLISSLLAIPISYYALGSWLENFAYRIELADHWIIFIGGSLICLILAMVTITIRSINAAQSNPSDSLRCE